MLITAFFTDSGVPKTGLFPTVNAWKSDGTLVIDKQVMLERAGGFYDYDFVGYNNSENYTFVADAGSSLFNYDRYVYGTNNTSNLAKIGEYDITLSGIQSDLDNPNQYKADLSNIETYMLRALGLMQENQYLDQTVYTNYQGIKLLTSGRIRSYSSASSVGTDNDIIAIYNITTTWNGDEMTSYKVVKT